MRSRFECAETVSKATRRSRMSSAAVNLPSGWLSDVFATSAARRADHRQHLASGRRIGAKDAEHPARHHADPGLVDAAGGHALMRRLDDHRDALGLQYLIERVGDLRRHLFLNLQALGIDFDEPRQL